MSEISVLVLSSRDIHPSNIIQGKGGRGGNWAYGQARVMLIAEIFSVHYIDPKTMYYIDLYSLTFLRNYASILLMHGK